MPTLCVVVHDDQTSSGNIVMTSPDCITWTSQNTPLADSGQTVAFGAGIFVIGTNGQSGGAEQIATSTDAVTWTARTSPADNHSVVKIIFAGGQFVALYNTSSGTSRAVMTSPDAITWTSHSIPSPGTPWVGLGYSPSLALYVACGQGGGLTDSIMTSPDAITWTDITVPDGVDFACVAWGVGIFPVMGGPGIAGGIRLITSPDANTWTVQSDPGGSNIHQWEDVVFGGGQFVAVADTGTGNRAATSPDGISWTLRSTPADKTWQGVAYSSGLGLYVACANQGTGTTQAVMTSPDGQSWALQTTPSNARFCMAAAFNEEPSPSDLSISCGGASGTFGVAYSSAFPASGGTPPYTFSIISGSLPPGLSLDPSTGVISGTPTGVGTYTFTIQVQGS